jgi:hypothetical protein
MFGLNNSVDALAEKVNGGSERLTAAITAATEQASDSSHQAARLSTKLNWLTFFIVLVGLIQAVALIYQIGHSPSPR